MDNQIIYQLFLAVFLGALLGLEREYKRKEAGLQTYSLVALGTCLFTIVSLQLGNSLAGGAMANFDPSRIIQAVAIGIGFIGAGSIFHQPSGIEGLTTAAGLWVTAAVGIAIGVGLYSLAVFTTLLSLIVLAGFGLLEHKIFVRKE